MAEIQLITGDCREVLRGLPEKSVHCCTTSPPYWGLRDYGLPPLVWGGDVECEHEWGEHQTGRVTGGGDRPPDSKWKNVAPDGQFDSQSVRSFCLKCGAWRGSLGLEPSPELYVQHLVEIFREVKRTLRDDATCWINLGDSYWGGKGQSGQGNPELQAARVAAGESFSQVAAHVGGQHKIRPADGKHPIIKPKDLVGIPWMVAFALRADGWWLRSDIIWHKPNCMPESVRDRPTKAHEYLFLLAKSKKYYYDQDVIREPQQMASRLRTMRGWDGDTKRDYPKGPQSHIDQYFNKSYEEAMALPGRNRRTVWTIPTKPFRGAHFAVFPPALIEPCILAGTSEYGVCPECGAPWTRMVKRTQITERDDTGRTHSLSEQRLTSPGAPPERGWEVERMTTGWQPTCDHDAEPTSAIVLDPFSGAGTTGVVAATHGRGYIGIELNPEYNEMARKRLAEVQPKLL